MSLLVLFAPDAHVGVILLRRNKVNLLIRWDTRGDSFQEGQWLKGTVRPSTMDLSPDGRYLVFEASRYGRQGNEAPSWTAVSRPPYWSALLFRSGWYAGMGGGSFTESGELLLSDDTVLVGEIEDRGTGGPAPVIRLVARPHREAPRGWDLITERPLLPSWRQVRDPRGLAQRSHDNGRILRLQRSGGPDLYAAEGIGECLPWEQITWADFDPNGRLLYAIGNTLHVSGPGEEGFTLELGERTFRQVTPPDSVLEW